jgi:hypothetical protein
MSANASPLPMRRNHSSLLPNSTRPARRRRRSRRSRGQVAFMEEASQRFRIPAAWIRAVMRIESANGVRAASPKGAMGLMQIMPQTWAEPRSRYRLGANPFDPHDNILAGAAYLRELHDRYGSPGFLAAYNAGPARCEDHRATGRPLPAETRAYMAVLAPQTKEDLVDSATPVAVAARSWAEASLFTSHSDGSPTTSGSPFNPHAEQPWHNTTAQDWTALVLRSEPLCPSIPAESATMSQVGLLRSLASSGVRLSAGPGLHGKPANRRRDKSTAVGRHACGWSDWAFSSASTPALLALDVKSLTKTKSDAPSAPVSTEAGPR